MTQEPNQIEELSTNIIDDLFRSIGFSATSLPRRLFGPLLWPPALRAAKLAATFDEYVAQSGICEAARWILPRFVKDVEARGAENIPREGPVLIASNHPGTYDALAIVSRLVRKDLKLVVSGIPAFSGLAFTRQQLIYATNDAHVRMAVARSVIRHLEEGGALLIFPTGKMDPDPAVLPGAPDALARWSPSLELVLRKVPQTRLVVTIVSGVIAPSALRNPIARLQKEIKKQQELAEFIQVFQQLFFELRESLIPRITFGEPLTAAELTSQDAPPGSLKAIIENAQRLLAAHIQRPEECPDSPPPFVGQYLA
jgi:hypothetical protein